LVTPIRWAEPASDDFLGIVEWLKGKNPSAALRPGWLILDGIESLERHPSISASPADQWEHGC
jgi:plasmid stabilization system protein ParE